MLTREEVERIEATLKRNLEDFEVHGGMVRYWASIIDAKTLLREYRTAMDERDALLAENRLLRDSLALVDDIDGWHLASNVRIALESAFLPRTAAEAERVRRLEAVLEAAEALIDARGAHIEGSVPLKNAINRCKECRGRQ